MIPKLPQQDSQAQMPGADVAVDDANLKISSFWLHAAWFQKMSREQRSLNFSNIIPLLPTKSPK